MQKKMNKANVKEASDVFCQEYCLVKYCFVSATGMGEY